MAGRLLVQQSRLIEPHGSEVILRGTSMQFRLGTGFAKPRSWDSRLFQFLGHANAVRLVALHWDDGKGSEDCIAAQPPYMDQRCMEQLEGILEWSTRLGLWAVVALRGEKAAVSLFTEAGKERKRQLTEAWKYVATRLRGRFRVAGYEVLSEPRAAATDTWWVADLYRRVCTAVREADGSTACVIGAAPFYSREGMDELYGWLRDMPNLIWNFNFFVPKAYVMNSSSEAGGKPQLEYPAYLRCDDVYTNDHVCKASAGKPGLARMIRVDVAFLRGELRKAAQFRDARQVPVLLDQWGVSLAAGEGRDLYAHDVASVCQELRLPWMYWTGRHLHRLGGSSDTNTGFGLLTVMVNSTGGVSYAWDSGVLKQLAPFWRTIRGCAVFPRRSGVLGGSR